MKRIIYIIFLLCTATAHAQQPVQLKLSLQQAIDTGLKNRYDIQAKKYNLVLANDRIKKNKHEWTPDLAVSGTIRYTPQIQATYIPGGFLGPDPGLVALGAKALTVFGLDLNQNIYKPTVKANVNIAKNNLEVEQERLRADENSIKEQIALAYLNVLLKQLQQKIALDNEQRNKEYMDLAAGKMKLGTLIENDYLRAKLDYENARIESQKAAQNYVLALDQVKYQVNVPAESLLVLTDSIDMQNLTLDNYWPGSGTTNRTEIKQLNLRQEGNKLEIDKIKKSALPTVSFYANYSEQFVYKNFSYTKGQWWSPFNYLGLHLSVPITAHFKNKDDIKEYNTKIIQADLELKQKTEDINFEVEKTTSELGNAAKNMQTAKSNYGLSQTIYTNQKQQYALGTLQYSNLLDTERSLNTAEQNYIKTVYDFLLANINYQKAIGNY